MAILRVPWVIALPPWVVPQTLLGEDIVDSPGERRLTQMVFQNPLEKLLLFLYVIYISCRWLNGLNRNSNQILGIFIAHNKLFVSIGGQTYI